MEKFIRRNIINIKNACSIEQKRQHNDMLGINGLNLLPVIRQMAFVSHVGSSCSDIQKMFYDDKPIDFLQKKLIDNPYEQTFLFDHENNIKIGIAPKIPIFEGFHLLISTFEDGIEDSGYALLIKEGVFYMSTWNYQIYNWCECEPLFEFGNYDDIFSLLFFVDELYIYKCLNIYNVKNILYKGTSKKFQDFKWTTVAENSSEALNELTDFFLWRKDYKLDTMNEIVHYDGGYFYIEDCISN